MNRFNWLVFFLTLLVFPSCNNSPQTNSNSKENKKDTITSGNIIAKDTVSSQLQKLLIHFKDTTGFPFVVDSAYIAHVPYHDSLGAKEVSMLSKNLVKDSLMDGINSTIHEFDTIDSLKANKLYSKWVEKLDIGMMQTANAYGLHKISLNDNTTALVWAMACTSYPADPDYSFTDVFITFLDNDIIGKTFLLGEEQIAADPPNFEQEEIKSSLDKNSILTLNYTIKNDYSEDDSTETLNSTHYEYLISTGDIQLQKKDYQKPRKIKTIFQ